MASDSSNAHVLQMQDSDMTMSMWEGLYDEFGTSAESPFDGNRLFDMNGAGAADSPNFVIKNTYEEDPTRQQNQSFHTRSLVSSRSAESSSQDSASETSGRKRQNTNGTSESPPAAHFVPVKREFDGMHPNTMNMNGSSTNLGPASMQHFGRSLHNLSLDADFAHQTQTQTQTQPKAQPNHMSNNFDFGSAASSPGGAMDMSDPNAYSALMQPQMNRPTAITGRSHHEASMGTVEPSQFFFGSSTASPASVKASQAPDASPGAIFSNPTPSSDGADVFNTNNMWTGAQNPSWNNDYSFASPGGALGLTPSPVMATATMTKANHAPAPAPSKGGRIPLHVAPIPAKSRVETQINIRLTLDWLPPKITTLHLPTHTIAKAKLLAKDATRQEDTLELHTMLVCTSAMNQPQLRQRAMERAAAQNNSEIQARSQAASLKKEDEEEAEEDKAANGGEVRICTNCINRERKRAARKKLKKEEEQAHWEKYETERVIVFNTNEYKQWSEWQQSPAPKDNNMQFGENYKPLDTAMQVVAPMRIACYCRHQNEKDGFQVIFTIKDQQGKVVAQQMSDSILITDDHKTHPLSAMAGQMWFESQQYPPAPAPFASHSMVDMHSHSQALQQSKSTSNLPSYGLIGGAQPYPNNMHPVSNLQSQTTSGAMTPRNLSRPGSPTNAGQAGPSKKRKSSSAHRRIPSTLTMTRVESNQPLPSASMTGPTPFSPSSAGFVGNDGSYMGMPHSASRTHFHTGPSTPIDQNAQFSFGALNRTNSMDSNAYAFYSAPSSAHQSRAPSPVLVGPNIAAFQRQQAHGPSINNRPNPFTMSASGMPPVMPDHDRPPAIINKINPAEGPLNGGIEVSIYGSGFTPSMTVMFGDQEAVTTTFWGEKALVALLPANNQTGAVPVTIAPSQMRQFPSPGGQAPLFNYANKAPDMQTMELALRFYSQKDLGSADEWQSLAQNAANLWVSSSQGPMVNAHSGYPGPQAAQFADQSNNLRFQQ